MKKDFNEIALRSGLFKGHLDWYFCYLKAEKIAHVLITLEQKTESPTPPDFKELVVSAQKLPGAVAGVAGGVASLPSLLSQVFALLSSLRLVGTRGYLSKETALILIQEYEGVVLRLVTEAHPSPFITAEDFVVAESWREERVVLPPSPFAALSGVAQSVKDIHKGQEYKKDARTQSPKKDDANRMASVLEVVKSNNGVSIKDISKVVRNCSAKTIQRELISLIEQGLVRREGERRWSTYFPVAERGEQ